MMKFFGVLVLCILIAGCNGVAGGKQGAVKDLPVSTIAQEQSSSRKEPGHGVRGSVFAPDGLPIVGVVVLAESLDNPKRRIPELAVVTSRDGLYWWPLREGRYRLSIAVGGYATVSHEVEVAPDAVERLDFTLQPMQR